VSSSDEKLQRARKLGASDLINYHNAPDWHLAVQEITPVVDREFTFDEALQAFAHMAEQRHFGKLVIKVAGG